MALRKMTCLNERRRLAYVKLIAKMARQAGLTLSRKNLLHDTSKECNLIC